MLHEAAATAHGKGDHLTAHELSQQAHEYSKKAFEHSQEAMREAAQKKWTLRYWLHADEFPTKSFMVRCSAAMEAAWPEGRAGRACVRGCLRRRLAMGSIRMG